MAIRKRRWIRRNPKPTCCSTRPAAILANGERLLARPNRPEEAKEFYRIYRVLADLLSRMAGDRLLVTPGALNLAEEHASPEWMDYHLAHLNAIAVRAFNGDSVNGDSRFSQARSFAEDAVRLFSHSARGLVIRNLDRLRATRQSLQSLQGLTGVDRLLTQIDAIAKTCGGKQFAYLDLSQYARAPVGGLLPAYLWDGEVLLGRSKFRTGRTCVQLNHGPHAPGPRNVNSLAVNRRCTSLHALYSLRCKARLHEDANLGCFTIQYAVGDVEEVTLEVAANNDTIDLDRLTDGGRLLVLRVGEWNVHRAGQEVESIGFVSGRAECQLCLVAVSVSWE